MTARRGTPVAKAPITGAGHAHVDYGLCGGHPTAAIVLRHSRAVWAEPIRSVTGRALALVMVHAMRYFGGAPRRFRFEGPHAPLATWHVDHWVFAPELAELARVCAVELDVYAIGAQGRGVCESALHALGKHGLHRLTLEQLRALHARNARRRRHLFQPSRTVAQVLADERPLLLPVPDGLWALEAALA